MANLGFDVKDTVVPRDTLSDDGLSHKKNLSIQANTMADLIFQANFDLWLLKLGDSRKMTRSLYAVRKC